jgi:hypothetical protein
LAGARLALAALAVVCGTVAGCASAAPTPAPTATEDQATIDVATPTPTREPTYTGDLRTLLVARPASASAMQMYGGRLNARNAAETLSPAQKDQEMRRLDELGFAGGAIEAWTKSGTTVIVMLLQFYDDNGASQFVDHYAPADGTAITGGRWYPGRNSRATFSRGGIAVAIQVAATTEADANVGLSLAQEQYTLLPEA